jgi:hypothetical protein
LNFLPACDLFEDRVTICMPITEAFTRLHFTISTPGNFPFCTIIFQLLELPVRGDLGSGNEKGRYKITAAS